MSRTVHSEHGVGSVSWRSVSEPTTLLATVIARSKDSKLSMSLCQHAYLIETSNLELLSTTRGVNRSDAPYSRPGTQLVKRAVRVQPSIRGGARDRGRHVVR